MDYTTILFIALVVVVTVYCSVRAASFAYFRTKLEYLRQLRQLMELGKGDKNGE